jgi:hypothetical protein
MFVVGSRVNLFLRKAGFRVKPRWTGDADKIRFMSEPRKEST